MAKHNNFPLIDWHIEHMKKTIVKFVTGLSDNPSRWERMQNKKYNTIFSVSRRLNHDIKHGVTNENIRLFLQKIDNDVSFTDLRGREGFESRFLQLEECFIRHK